MLQLLHIENIAVIERADISFRAGFNALTGETGAGKSIVIDSLGAVLGARTSRDLIRTGAAKAFVSAEFDGVDASLPVLAALGVEPEDGVLLLQRDIYADGKNICRANGRPITVAQLRALGTSLLNIHGQHEGTQLLDEEQHGAYLDRFARLDGLPEAYTERYQAARETRRQIEALEMDETEKARRVDTLRHQIAELERAELRDGEEEELLARRELLRNAEKFMDAFAAADYALSGGDDGLGAASQLKNAENALHSVRALGARFSELCERLESLYSDVYDLAETVRDLRSEMDFSPQELDAVESRADQLYRLKKKYVLPAPRRAPEQTPAWDALYEAAARMPGELTLVATGPLTNAAIALTAHPALRSLLRGIALMGGAAVGGNRTPCSEFNIHADPDAAEIVFSSGIPIIMCGLDVTEQAWFSPAEFAALPDTPVGRFARAATAGPMQKNMARGAGGLCLHDVCPVLYLTHPELFTGRQAGVHVETRGTVTYAKTVTDLDSDAKFPERNVFVVLGVDRAGFAAHITEALSSYAG